MARCVSCGCHAAATGGDSVPTWPNWVWVSSAKNWHDSYQALGRYGEAEPLYRRSLAILEKALGPKHPSVATNLENYAALLRESGRTAEAEKEARAKAIRVKRAKENN